MTFTSSALLDRKIENIVLSYRKIPSVRLKEVENILQENPHPPRLETGEVLSLIHISEPTRRYAIADGGVCL